MNDELSILASAYLDGDVTADERARVESSPELLEEVERLRIIRAVVADGEPPPISMRERHLAAALEAWDRLPEAERTGARRDITPMGVDAAAVAGAASVSAPPPLLDARRRPRNTGWLLAAAAGLIVVLGGGFIIRSLATTGNGDDDVATDDVAATEAPAAEEARSAGGAVDEPAEDSFQDESQAEVAIEAAPAPADAAEAVEDLAAEEAGDAPVELDTEPDPAFDTPAPEDDLEVLSSQEELAIFALDFLRLQSPTTDVPAIDPETGVQFPLCTTDVVVGPAIYQGEPVLVGVDFSREIAIAYRADDCVEVARALLSP